MNKPNILSKSSSRGRRKKLAPVMEDLAGRPAGPPGQEEAPAPEPETSPPKGKDAPWMPVAHIAAKIVLVVFVIWFVFTYVFAAFQVSGNVMYPSIRTGDLLLAYRLQGDYVQDDVVLFRYNDVTRVARIVAQGGDVVELTDDGDLVVNGNVQQEDIFYPTEEQSTLLKYPYVVPENSYFLLCDYRTAAQDSRDFGAVSQDDIVGKVITLLRRRGI